MADVVSAPLMRHLNRQRVSGPFGVLSIDTD